MEPDPLDAVFAALAHPARRQMLDIVKDKPGCNVAHVTGHFEMSRIAVMKHLRVLSQARLLLNEKVGRDRVLHFNAVPIQEIYDRWTDEYSALWAAKLTDLKHRIENSAPESTPELTPGAALAAPKQARPKKVQPKRVRTAKP